MGENLQKKNVAFNYTVNKKKTSKQIQFACLLQFFLLLLWIVFFSFFSNMLCSKWSYLINIKYISWRFLFFSSNKYLQGYWGKKHKMYMSLTFYYSDGKSWHDREEQCKNKIRSNLYVSALSWLKTFAIDGFDV